MAFVKAAPTLSELPPQDPQILNTLQSLSRHSHSQLYRQRPQNHQRPLKFSEVSLTSFINKRNLHTENKKEVRQSEKQGSSSRLEPARQAGTVRAAPARKTGIIRVDSFSPNLLFCTTATFNI